MPAALRGWPARAGTACPAHRQRHAHAPAAAWGWGWQTARSPATGSLTGARPPPAPDRTRGCVPTGAGSPPGPGRRHSRRGWPGRAFAAGTSNTPAATKPRQTPQTRAPPARTSGCRPEWPRAGARPSGVGPARPSARRRGAFRSPGKAAHRPRWRLRSACLRAAPPPRGRGGRMWRRGRRARSARAHGPGRQSAPPTSPWCQTPRCNPAPETPRAPWHRVPPGPRTGSGGSSPGARCAHRPTHWWRPARVSQSRCRAGP